MTKTFWAAAMTAVLLATPAAAQMGSKRGGGGGETKAAPSAPTIDDRAYKAALERIPDSKEKYDPWGGVVPAATAKKPK